jgi:hypothetical protein
MTNICDQMIFYFLPITSMYQMILKDQFAIDQYLFVPKDF